MEPSELLSRAAREDPYPVYRGLQGRGPLQLGPDRWVLLDQADVRAALGDPVTFSSNLRGIDNPVFRASPLVFDDPPRHTHLRRLVAAALTPRRIALMVPWLRARTDELLDELGPGPADVVAGLAQPLPVSAIAHLLGVPAEDHGRFRQWSGDRTFVAYHGNAGAPRSAELEAAEVGCAAFEQYLRHLIAERRPPAGPDLLGALVAAEVDGDALSTDEVVGIAAVLLSAGNITTTRLLANLLHHLAGHPQHWADLRARRDGVGPLVEEILRLESPVQFPARVTTRDVALSGVRIPAGRFVMIGLGAANRDPAAVGAPDTVDPGRIEPHLAFGAGIHFCAGAALARQEAAVALDAMLARYSSIRVAGPARPDPGLAHRGWAELVLELAADGP